ncbi:MAG: hypothetical protein ACK5FE_11120 [Cyanobacteriota bacterium]|jgi:hypothetical protein
MKEIHLHVGLHKTGTTSLQKFCASKSAELFAGGIFYPDLSWPPGSKWDGNASVSIQSVFSDRTHYLLDTTDSKEKLGASEILHKLETKRPHGATVISAEAISALKPDELQDLRNFLTKDCGFERIVVYLTVREYYSFLCSDVQQRIKMGYPCMHDIREGLYSLPKASQRVRNIAKAFDGHDMVFIDFGEAKANGGIENAFFDAFNKTSRKTSYELKPDSTTILLNESLGNITTRIMDFYNELKPYDTDTVRQAETIGLAKLKQIDDLIPNQSRFLLTSDELAQCLDFIESENSQLNSVTGYNLTVDTAKTAKPVSRGDALCFLVEGVLKAL